MSEAKAKPTRRSRPAGEPTADISAPPQSRARLRAWLGLLLCLIAASPAALIEVRRAQVTDELEARTLVGSVDTWKRQPVGQAPPGALNTLVPYYNGQKRIDTPPGATWLHLVALAPLDKATATPRQIIARARGVSFVMLLLCVAGVYWSGLTIGGLRTAMVAALLCAANPFMIMHARQASPPIMFVAWAMLGIAAALWALRPLRPPPSVARQATGWAIAGVAMGAATLTLGPAALAGVALPVLVIILLCPNRTSHLLGLLAALLIGVLIVLPWVAHLQSIDPAAGERLLSIVTAWSLSDLTQYGATAPLRAAVLVIVLLPWALWVVGAMLQPFSTSSEGLRVRLFIGWSWFVLATGVYLLLPVAMPEAALLVVAPAASVMLGQLFNQLAALSESGRPARLWRALRWPHVILLALMSVMLPLTLYGPVLLPDIAWPIAGDIAPRWPMALGLGVALLTITALSLRHAARDFPHRAVIAWLVWALVATTIMAIPYARGPLGRQALRADARKLVDVTGQLPVYYLSDDANASLPPALLLYGRAPMPTLPADELATLLADAEPFYVLTLGETSPPGRYAHVANLTDAGLTVWRYDGGSHDTP